MALRRWLKRLGWAVALVITFFVVASCVLNSRFAPPKTVVSARIHTVVWGCRLYHQEYGVLPATTTNSALSRILFGDNPRKISFIEVDRLGTNTAGEVIDTWNTPLRITFPTTNSVRVESAGEDRVFGTKDDIVEGR
jgi:hypothetical protein